MLRSPMDRQEARTDVQGQQRDGNSNEEPKKKKKKLNRLKKKKKKPL